MTDVDAIKRSLRKLQDALRALNRYHRLLKAEARTVRSQAGGPCGVLTKLGTPCRKTAWATAGVARTVGREWTR
jgi:hypothetical protein